MHNIDKITEYSIYNILHDYAYTMIKVVEENYNYKFTKQELDKIMVFGEKIISENLPNMSFTFSIKDNEKEQFDSFVGEFTNSFVSLFLIIIKLFADLVYQTSRRNEPIEE